jgi:hypothetical protein
LIERLFLACRTEQVRAGKICLLAGMSLLRSIRIFYVVFHQSQSGSYQILDLVKASGGFGLWTSVMNSLM